MFLDTLSELMKRHGINKHVLAKESGIPYTTIDGWFKKGYDDIRLSTLKKLRNYFGVSLDYLMNEIQSSDRLLENEKAPAITLEPSSPAYKLLTTFQSLQPADQHALLLFADHIALAASKSSNQAADRQEREVDPHTARIVEIARQDLQAETPAAEEL